MQTHWDFAACDILESLLRGFETVAAGLAAEGVDEREQLARSVGVLLNPNSVHI